VTFKSDRSDASPFEAVRELLKLCFFFSANLVAVKLEVDWIRGAASNLTYAATTVTVEACITLLTVSILSTFRFNDARPTITEFV
jgi:hypothetical protein